MGNFLDLIRGSMKAKADFIWPARNLGPGAIYSDFDRVANYQRYQKIYYGDFGGAFRDSRFGMYPVPKKANLASRSVETLHSAIWVKPPEPRSSDEKMQFFAHQILENNRVEEAIAGSLRDTILHGDGVLKISIVDSRLTVENVHPGNYYPELSQPNPQRPQAHNIVWPDSTMNGQPVYFNRERYWYNEETASWWLTTTRFNATTGDESAPIDNLDLKCTFSPIIHTYSARLSGIFWGKSPLADCEDAVGDYAAAMARISRIEQMASTRALLVAPDYAFDDRGNLVWDTDRPLQIDAADLGTFDKSRFGFIDPPGGNMITSVLESRKESKADVYESFGLTPSAFGETGGLRDVGEPGLARVNLMTEFTVQRYQKKFGLFLNDAINVAAQFAREWLEADLPDAYGAVEFTWADFAPQSEGEKADTLQKKVLLGLPQAKALEEMGYPNGEDLVTQRASEIAGNFGALLPHSPYDVVNPDPEIERRVNELMEDGPAN